MQKLFENFRRYINEDEEKSIATISGYIISGEVSDVKFAYHPIRAMGQKWVETITDENGFYKINIPYAGRWTIIVSDKDHTVNPPKKKYIRSYTEIDFKGGEKVDRSLNILDLDKNAPDGTKNLYKPGDIIGITPPRR
tara:strand:- start:199 stop:612 length:414 start_codon:yes stop_codon:yes gene_type:complete